MKLPKLTRALDSVDVKVDSEQRTMTFPFSSETPVERFFGDEVLSHSTSAKIDLSRLNDGAPLLFNHDMDQIVGVVENANINTKERRGYATVRFANTDRARELLGMVQDGILRNVSFGYRIGKMEETGTRDQKEYTATEWAPYEISLVTVPADNSVGIGRSEQTDERDVEVLTRDFKPAAAAATHEKEIAMTQANTAAADNAVDIKVIESQAASAERARIATINALGDKFSKGDLARQLVDSGKSIDEARAAFLEQMNVRAEKPVAEGAASLDLSKKEAQSYSLVRAINAALKNDWSKAGYEAECSRAIAQMRGKDTAGFFMPMNIRATSDSAYNTGTAGEGGNLVATNLLAGSFIDVLRNKARVAQLGARFLTGLVGKVDIPRQTSQTATYWVSEGADVTEAEAAFDKLSLSPKTLGARSQYTRQMLLQSTPDIEMLVRNDLAAVLALAIDKAAVLGTGADGQPTGILNTSGIGSVVGGTTGGAITIDHLIDLETKVKTANAPEDALAYLVNAKTVGALKKLKSTTGQYLWSDNPMGQRSGTPGSINGYNVAVSNQMPSDGTKSTGTGLSTLVFGDWSELIIGEWGTLEILPNPYGAGFNSGSVDIRALQTIDIGVRHAASFAAMTDAITG